ncbi:MAG: DNRLRE domain-containing protein, partial [Clostridia bacterium]|nr:DNRLRE domain-containing protein [Clostridia bacterium]
MKRKIFSSALCIILSFLMIVYAVPSSAVAYAIEELTELFEAEDTLTEEFSEQNEEKELDALFELEEMRTADTKYVRMSDGTYKALIYDGAVHELDENGKYVEIDNSLTASSSDYETGNARVKFSKKITGNDRIFKLKKDSYQIALALENAAKGTKISVLNDGKEEIKAATKLEEISTLTKLTSSVSYKDILEGVDLEYVLTGENLKENIVVKEQSENYVYTFTLSLNGLTARLTDEGDVFLENEDGEIVYTMPAPFMTDASGVYSEDVSYALEATNGNGKYALTVTASSSWMNAEERTFPVTIDPTVEVSGSEKVADTYTDEAYPTTSYGSSTTLYVGTKNGYSQFALFMLGELADLPAGSMVTNVLLMVDILDNPSISTQTLNARKIEGDRTSLSGINANTELTVSSDIYDYVEIPVGAIDICALDITRMYHEWVTEGKCRIVQLSVETDISGNYLGLASSNYPNTTQLKPTFEITYINTIGTESYFSYSTQSAGAAGSAAISDHSGQLTISFTDAVSDNSALSVSVGHVYNSILANENYTVLKANSASNLFSSMKTGNGFMLTTQQTLQVQTVDNASYAVYTDSDGTIHYFEVSNYISSADGVGATEYSDTEGLGLTAVDPNSATFASDYSFFKNMGFSYASSMILKDNAGNQLLFYCGLPAVYKDKNQNITKYLYNTTSSSGNWFPDGSDDQLRAIVQNNALENGLQTADIQVATLTYSDEYLSSIASPGRTVYYAYETYGTDKLLTAVAVSEYLNSSSSYTTYTLAEYGYTNGVLTDLYDTERQYGIHYTYDTAVDEYTGYYEFAGTIAS